MLSVLCPGVCSDMRARDLLAAIAMSFSMCFGMTDKRSLKWKNPTSVYSREYFWEKFSPAEKNFFPRCAPCSIGNAVIHLHACLIRFAPKFSRRFSSVGEVARPSVACRARVGARPCAAPKQRGLNSPRAPLATTRI